MGVLSIDQSTTSTTAILYDAGGKGREVFAAQHRQIYPGADMVEHDPAELLSHLRAALAAGRLAGAEVVALANQGESCLAWDAVTKEPLSPVLVWQDGRTAAACREMDAAHGALIRARTGLPVEPYFSAPKLRWITEHVLEVRRAMDRGQLRLGTTDAYFRDALGAGFATDIATASRTGLMDLARGVWDREVCALYGLPVESLPEITACSGDLGALEGLPLRAAIVDQQAACFGHGLAKAGEVKITFGTGAFAFALCGTEVPQAEGPLPTVAWQEAGGPVIYALDGGIHTASAAVNWGRGLGLFDDFAEIGGFGGPSALERGLVFVPALAGLACPHWDRAARGAWLGLTLDTTPAEMMRAMLEGIAYRSAEVLAAMSAAPGVLRVDGGMTANRWFCQLLADVTGREVQVSAVPELTGFGAARLAARAMGGDLVLPDAAAHLVPDPAARPLHDRFAAARRLVQDWGGITGE
ncbi:FGGY family carbohydrate kinase [Pseudooceanicola sp. C21-150M6]|uniref:FGGY family carbohydrate kinase n=1 Tax=Pseudooceanicola sp. C21-150M6 TaxID=3434355 RepID=UPI003D7F575A